jgi:uncharacterized protein YraI
MKARYWSLAIVLFLINYLIFATLFSHLVGGDFKANYATRTPIPTFTPAPALLPAFAIPTLTPIPVAPTPTATRVLVEPEANSGSDTVPEVAAAGAAEQANQPELIAPGSVNIRSGPGLNYAVIGTLNADTAVPIVGRNADTTWWEIEITGDTTGWVAGSVVQATNADNVPVAEAPPPPPQTSAAVVPQPAADSAPAAPEKPEYQYEPTGWWDDGNAGLTRFMGDIKDVSGNPVNGAFIQASCGDYSTISMPSGPVGWGPLNESADWPAGFYDVVVDTRPVPCIWMLTVVDTDDRKTVKDRLSESIPVEVTLEKSIIIANWRKNW